MAEEIECALAVPVSAEPTGTSVTPTATESPTVETATSPERSWMKTGMGSAITAGIPETVRKSRIDRDSGFLYESNYGRLTQAACFLFFAVAFSSVGAVS